MGLRENFQTRLKESMQARDQMSTSTIRLISAALKDRDIAARSKGNTDGIPDEEILQMLQTMIKQRRESIKMYEQGNRPELAKGEADEIQIIEEFLPRQITGPEMEDAINDTIAKEGAANIKDMGKVMNSLRADYAGQMDFGKASAVVKKKLTT